MKTCAKVNLFLKITGKRPDGYHELENIFWPLPWLQDTVTVTMKTSGGISMECEAPGVPVDETNLCWKAAKVFLETSALPLSPHIALTKRIPIAAGLGGGSSDAAATLLELNRLTGNPLDSAKLHAIAANLGADVPFFLNPIPSLATGIGEVLSPVSSKGSCHIFLANPQFPVPASWAYKHWHEDFIDKKVSCEEILAFMKSGEWGNVFSRIRNDLEYCIFRKFQILGIVRERMEALGIFNVHISGSGPTLFGLSSPEISAKAKPLLEEEFSGFLRCYCEGHE